MDQPSVLQRHFIVQLKRHILRVLRGALQDAVEEELLNRNVRTRTASNYA